MVDGTFFDDTEPPGDNFDEAAFRLWLPRGNASVRAIVVLMPGSNGDGRPEAADPFWQKFASDHNLALLGCQFTDKPHDQKFVEQYANASLGSGQALLDAINNLANRSKHPEIASAPLFLWGMSAGGEFNYEFAAWKPERVAAFIVNKGGIYVSALTPAATRAVPGILFIGGKDLVFRTAIISGLFALNRRAGALWALAAQPNDAHVVGRSRDLAAIFFEDLLPLRLDSVGSATLKALDSSLGFVGDLKSNTIQFAPADAPPESTVWLPTLRVARAWQALINDQPLDQQ